jgi:hypothetical protein
MTSWFTGVAGLARSAGTVGWLTGSALGSDGGTSAATGILQTANSLGLFVFNLSVLKSMTVSQAPTGTVLPGGQLDAVRAIDIGQWVFGIPGLFTNTGTVGFVADAGGGAGYGTARWVGGLQTTTQIGPFSFTLNFLPSFSFGTSTPTNGSGGTTTGTGSDCGTTNVDANVTAWSLSDGQRSADLWDASTHHDSNVENDADVTPDGSDSSDVATSTAAVRPAATTPVTASETVQTADEPQVVTETAVSSRPRPAGTTELNGAGTPDADSNDQGARHTARENGSPVTNRSIGYIGKHDAADDYLGRHRSDDGYTGKHRSDDGYIGKHRSNDGSASTEASSAQDGLGSTNGESTTPSER